MHSQVVYVTVGNSLSNKIQCRRIKRSLRMFVWNFSICFFGGDWLGLTPWSLNCIRQNISRCSPDIKSLAYSSLVGPHLEHGSDQDNIYRTISFPASQLLISDHHRRLPPALNYNLNIKMVFIYTWSRRNRLSPLLSSALETFVIG